MTSLAIVPLVAFRKTILFLMFWHSWGNMNFIFTSPFFKCIGTEFGTSIPTYMLCGFWLSVVEWYWKFHQFVLLLIYVSVILSLIQICKKLWLSVTKYQKIIKSCTSSYIDMFWIWCSVYLNFIRDQHLEWLILTSHHRSCALNITRIPSGLCDLSSSMSVSSLAFFLLWLGEYGDTGAIWLVYFLAFFVITYIMIHYQCIWL